ncbi:hypothetical protein WD019_16080 [Fictibacillus sp. Mic-4]|uniref:hypothetical protein n=1 Tax=Fictibacillus sp. Mic-4 TaxID=3132826 RepID=UPI003CEA687C
MKFTLQDGLLAQVSIKGPILQGVNAAKDGLTEHIVNSIGHTIVDCAYYVSQLLTVNMPIIGGCIVLGCGIMMMVTGDVGKWLSRCLIGLAGAVVWLISV